MDAVIKVGGSLAANPCVLRTLCETLGNLAKQHKIVVVPGGGEFADLVREIDKRYSLLPIIAHRMAILGMDQYGLLLSQLIPNSLRVQTLTETRDTQKSDKAAVFLPSKLMSEVDSLEASWEVTSDSIAAYIASQLHVKKLVLVTDVDGLFTSDPKMVPEAKFVRTISTLDLMRKSERTCIDKFLPRLLVETNQGCFVVNGNHPDRIEKILANEGAVSTRILVE